MTHIAYVNHKFGKDITKKMLKETIKENPDQVYFNDPSIFPGAWSGGASQMEVGQKLVCTNHPKRSWFAQVVRTEDGFKVS